MLRINGLENTKVTDP